MPAAIHIWIVPVNRARVFVVALALLVGCTRQDEPSATPPLAVTSAAVASAAVASPAVTELTGQVFVVTKSRRNIRLALVRVMAVPEPVVRKALAEPARAGLDELSRLKGEFTKATKVADAAALAAIPAEERIQAAGRTWGKAPVGDEHAERELAEARAATEKPLEAAQKAAAKAKASRDALLAFDVMAAFDLAIPNNSPTAKSDADGKFVIALHEPGRHLIIAKAIREVPPENYRWLVWITAKSGEKASVMLSNDNLVETQCPDCTTLEAIAAMASK